MKTEHTELTSYRLQRRNESLLKQKASKHSIQGVIIGLIAIVIATMVSGYSMTGELSLDAFLTAQKTNFVLWFLNAMPFVFAIWGQYVSSILSTEASAMVLEQTDELRKQSSILEQKAAYDATHDSLTGLPNRILFLDRLQQATNSANRDATVLGVMILDMDRFKEINDTLGHHNGDVLLKQIGLRLAGAIRESDTLARIGGDEFGFVLPNLKTRDNAKKTATKIIRSLYNPFVLDNLSLEIQVSIGLSIFPEHGKDADTLVQKADVAMYTAKQSNLDFTVYKQEFDKYSPHRLTLMAELRKAINEDELTLHYQPKVSSETGQLHSAEALVRWNHPIHGLMPPDEFIPLAERTGMIDDLTLWVLRKSLHQHSLWHQQGLSIGNAVNLSSLCLLNPNFPDTLIGLLSSYSFPARLLILEITETSIMVDPDRARAILNRIHQIGVKFSIDDFGTGYSSLAYLKNLPVSELKIDKSFVMDMMDNKSDTTIVKATIQLGHNLGLKTVAEGVESQEIFDILRAMGCDFQQGYHICRPIPSGAFTTWSKEQMKKRVIISIPD